MLDGLRNIPVEHGAVTSELIDAANLRCARSYAFRFKGLVAALDATGLSGSGMTCNVISTFRIRCITKDLVGAMLHCPVLAKATIEWMTCRTFRINGVMVRFLCTTCRYERSHACWHVALRYTRPSISFYGCGWAKQTNNLPRSTFCRCLRFPRTATYGRVPFRLVGTSSMRMRQ
jgi:hypothetical protein